MHRGERLEVTGVINFVITCLDLALIFAARCCCRPRGLCRVAARGVARRRRPAAIEIRDYSPQPRDKDEDARQEYFDAHLRISPSSGRSGDVVEHPGALVVPEDSSGPESVEVAF